MAERTLAASCGCHRIDTLKLRLADETTTISERPEAGDPIVQRLKSLKIEEIGNKIEVVDALSFKLLQRFNYSVSALRTTLQHLSEVHAVQMNIGELKGRLTDVITNCDALCKRIDAEGPESRWPSLKLFTISNADSKGSSDSSAENRSQN